MSLRWSEEDLARFHCRQTPEPEKKAKYGNKKIVTPEGTFDSKWEYERYQQLKMLQKAGQISNLKRQVEFILAPAMVIQGKKRPPLRYFADFQYTEDGAKVVEDTKGVLTDVYIVKRHLMKAFHGVDIREVKK